MTEKTTGKIFIFTYFIFLIMIFPQKIFAIDISISINPEVVKKGSTFVYTIRVESDKFIDIKSLPEVEDSFYIKFLSKKPELIRKNIFRFDGYSIYQQHILEIQYQLKALKEGAFEFPSFRFKTNITPIISKSFDFFITSKDARNKSLSENFAVFDIQKSELIVGEELVVSVILYSTKDYMDLDIYETKKLDGFYYERLHLPASKKKINILDKTYNKIVVDKYRLIPKEPGVYVLPDLRIRINSYVTSIKSNVIPVKNNFNSIKVNGFEDEIPNNYIGLIGNYKANYQIERIKNKNNDYLKMKISVEGKGNHNLIRYDDIIKPNNYFNIIGPSLDSSDNSLAITFLLIPNFTGSLKLPTIDFSYYNSDINKFDTIYIPGETVQISKINNNEINSEIIKNNYKLKIYKKYDIDKKYSFYEIMIIFLIPYLLIPLALFINFLKRRKSNKEKKDILSYYDSWLYFIRKIGYESLSEDEIYSFIEKKYNMKRIKFLKEVKNNLNKMYNNKEDINYKILKKFKKWALKRK